MSTDGLVQRRNTSAASSLDNNGQLCRHRCGRSGSSSDSGSGGSDRKEVRLTLMEQVLLLGLKDREGYTSFWNDSLSAGLRGAILVELALRGRVSLEPSSPRKRHLESRRLVCLSGRLVGDALLDEALRRIKATQPAETVATWVEYFNGESWNPFKLGYQLRNVRERLAKSLAEKSICSTEKRNFVLFDMTTYPLVDSVTKRGVLKKVQNALLTRWQSDPQRMDQRSLALVYLAQASNVLEGALAALSDDDYDLAMRRVKGLLRLDFSAESAKENACSVLWAVASMFDK